MLDPKHFRNSLVQTGDLLKKRGFTLDIAPIAKLEEHRKSLQVEIQQLQNQRNVQSKSVGILKSQGKDTSDLLNTLNTLSDELSLKDKSLQALQDEIQGIYASTPNIPHLSVPEGLTENSNLEIRRVGTPPSFSFTPQDHIALGEGLGQMDFAAASTIAGARFVTLKGPLAKLQRALIQFMLDVHTQEHGYTEVYVPYLVNAQSLFSTGQLPKFEQDLFKIEGERTFYLIPTAEVPVTNLVRDQIIPLKDLPLRFVCHTPCFRSEAGSYGKDMKGMIRQHQFEKVELVQIVKPENSYEILEKLTFHAESILQKLGLAYRVVSLCGGDLGFSAAKTFDIEVWLPGQNQYREISSCSNFEDFQARRMQARYKDPDTQKTEFVHTLNGSGLAVGRTLIAILENFQDKEGNIEIPPLLIPYFGSHRIIREKK